MHNWGNSFWIIYCFINMSRCANSCTHLYDFTRVIIRVLLELLLYGSFCAYDVLVTGNSYHCNCFYLFVYQNLLFVLVEFGPSCKQQIVASHVSISVRGFGSVGNDDCMVCFISNTHSLHTDFLGRRFINIISIILILLV